MPLKSLKWPLNLPDPVTAIVTRVILSDENATLRCAILTRVIEAMREDGDYAQCSMNELIFLQMMARTVPTRVAASAARDMMQIIVACKPKPQSTR